MMLRYIKDVLYLLADKLQDMENKAYYKLGHSAAKSIITRLYERMINDKSLDTQDMGVLEDYLKEDGAVTLSDDGMKLMIKFHQFEFEVYPLINGNTAIVRTTDIVSHPFRLKEDGKPFRLPIPEMDLKYDGREWNISNPVERQGSNRLKDMFWQYYKRLEAHIDNILAELMK
jgi:hypothetical protein